MSKKLLCLMPFLLVLGMVADARSADEIYFTELFDDGNFSSRGWYDNTSLVLSTTEHIPGSTSSVEYHFNQGATTPTSGGGIRKLFTETETVYLSFYIKHSTNWTGSNKAYHPHEFHFMTNLDGAWGGLADTFSTYYIEENEGEPQLALQDAQNIDESNIGVDLTDITEYRAIAGCNGNSDGTGVDDCYSSGSGHANGKKWEAGSVYFQDSTGPYYKADWHFIEAYFQLNSIVEGVGVADGQAKYWYDGELIINQENLILRTGEHPGMKFRQLIIAFWIGDGSPVAQTVWVDDLTVANYRAGSSSPPGQATSPSPANSATDVSISADLSWTAGSGATSHDVYFGTDSTPDSGEFQGNQAGTTFDPGTMANSTTYYWRIDEVNGQGTTTGNVWNFTTETAGSPPGQASNPSPANSAANVSVNADLNWTAGSGSTSTDVYFGTDPTPDSGEFIGNQTDTNYNPGTLQNDTTYYWRIDELNGYGTTTGTVWNFTTAPPGTTVLLVDFGGTEAQNSFGLAGWNTVIKDTYTDYRSIGPGGTTIVTGQNPDYDYQGVTGSSRDFVVDEEIVVTWYNNSASQINFTPRLSFTDSDRPDAGWYSMTQTIVAPYGTNTSQFVLDAGSAGNYSLVNVNCYYTNNQILICDKIELITAAASPGQASNPTPADSAADVSITADLSWTAGSGATSHDVYFGTTSPGTFQGNQTATTFEPGTMSNDTTYYWRIDEINAAGTTTGNVWNFTTAAAAQGDVEIIGSWTSGTTHTEEAGSNRALIFIAHAESSADTSDLGSVTYGGQSMTKVVERNMHLSYSAYTCAFILDEAGIDAATSGTFVPSWNTSPSGTPAYTSVFLQNVNQTTLTGATGTGGTSTTTAETPALSTNDGDMAIVAGTCGNDATYSTINSFTEAIEVAPSSADGIGGYLACTGANVTPGVSHTNVNRQSVIGFVVKAGTGGPTPPGQASNPTPANSATDVAVNANLSWTAGTGSTSSDVYFGTSSPGSFQGNQTAATFDPGTMSNDTTYYWRIDEVNSAGTTTGNVWNFTTIVAAPGQASSPSPANSATGVSITADLSWTAGSGATSHDVYFGTSSPGSFQGNQTATTFDAGTIANDTTYYWRIDEVNAAGTTAGTVWSFTTIVSAPAQASSPSPANSATGVSITADLSWNAGSGATSHDVYFGTSSPGSFQGNQTATTYDTGTMSNDTTYYWRIDEVNAGGTTNGNVWSFTTIVAQAAQATNPGPADSATNVSIDADLSWTAGSGATSHDVYFGTSSPGAFQGNQTAATFEPGTMSNDTTYYWRIDELNAAGTTTGTVWSFTTVTAGQPVTEEFGDATNTDHPGTIEDTFTNQGGGGTGNYSTDDLLSTYTWPADTVANTTIIKWDLSSIPTDATVTEATLYLYQVSMTGDTSYDIPVHKIINVNPVISACNWNTYDGTNSWTGGADGGQSDTAAAEDTQVVDATNNVYKTWTVTNMVADWVAAPSSNYGMLVNSDDVATIDSCRYFASTEVVDAATRPKLIVTYISGSPSLATNPDPADSATDVTVDAVLSWTAGAGATSHDVYFGSTSPGSFQGNQTQTTFDPGTLSYNITYYWRIDEVNASGTTTGNVWSFTTEAAPQPPGQATNPSPADSATNVSINADLSWTAGTGSTSSDVYFGTSSPGAFQGNQTATTFDPGAMANDTTYYWRIDEINADGTTTGNVWSFTTIVAAPAQATNPAPSNSATNVSINANLSWTAGSGATSHDVYFGTDSTPDSGELQGNQTATTFDPGTMANDTTYYWRIDEVNAGGTTAGPVWNFTTEAAPQPPGQASNPNPADSATDVSINADLSWTAGSGSTSSDVYFGTTSPGTFQGNQTATTFDPGTMANDTTYYWRIDEINAVGTTTGVVWSFTTIVSTGDEIIGWWPLDDGTGSTAADSTAYGNDGTLVGSPSWTNDAERGWCLDFSGNDNYVTIPNESFFDIVGNITVMAWMKDDYTDWRNLSTIIAKGRDGSGGWGLQKAKRTNAMSFYVDVLDMPWDGIKAGVGIFDNQWHHVAGVYDGSNAYIYIDGGLDSNSVACSGSMATNNWDVYIGENAESRDAGSNGREWDGLLSDVRVYNYALTQSQVNDIYTGGPTPPGQASNPSPADSATDVSIDADLSWTEGSDSTSSDVYFGTTSPGTFQGNQTATTFDPGTMANDTTYYWRIDEINTAGTTTGNVWSFTTVAAPPSDVEIIGSWVSGTSHTAESGTNRLLVFTAHAEDNNADMNITSVTYGGQSMTEVIEDNEGTGYRAYAALFVLDEAGINAASGSSFVVTWAEVPNRTPAYTSVFMQNVNQTSPVGASASNGGTTATVSTSALSTNDGDMVVLAATCGNTGTYSLNNGFTETVELSMVSADGVAGYKAATGANETPSVTHSNINRQVIAGLVVQAQ